MNTPPPLKIFDAKVVQVKYPPRRISAASGEPLTADTQEQNRPKHHGSETRQTQQIAGRVLPHVKTEVVRVAKLKGWTQSKTVATLVEQALAHSLAEQFGVMLKATIQDAITKQLQKDNNRVANLALEAFYSAEEGRILTIYILRFLLGSDIEILPQIIKESQEQARENMKGYAGAQEEVETNHGSSETQIYQKQTTGEEASALYYPPPRGDPRNNHPASFWQRWPHGETESLRDDQ